MIGGRSIVAITASAAISPELRAWVESMLGMPLREAYGATEPEASWSTVWRNVRR